MIEKEIKCYFCGNKAIQREGYSYTRNVRIECDYCKIYEFTDVITRFYLDEDKRELIYTEEETGEKKKLPQELKDKLSDYIRRKFDPNKGEPVLIKSEIFTAITGKRSVHKRYK